jgi:squalene synthase HpnC
MAASQAIETPSGKGAGDENFPVGSWLLPARLRPHVAAYYRFARAIDDIADNPELAPEDKIARLTPMAAAVTGEETGGPALETAHRMRASLAETGVSARHCLDLVTAFKQDAVKLRYRDWPDLLGYCEYSANPVGRYLLDLHGERAAGYPYSDALCSALQVLNHLQDCQDDYRNLDRVYLPLDWMAAEGIDVAALDAGRCAPGLRRVIDRCLDGVDELIAAARELPAHLRSPRLAMESAVIVRLAERLTRRLRAGDPLAGRVALSRLDFAACGLRGAGGVVLGRLVGAGRSAQPARQGP